MPTGHTGKRDIREEQGYRHVLLVAVLNYELRERVRTSMSGMVVAQLDSPYPATGVWLQGQLRLKQRLPLRIRDQVRSVYAVSPLDVTWTSNWAAANYPVTVRNLIERYNSRNETIYLEPQSPPIWDFEPRDTFRVELVVDVAPEVVRYVPGAMEVIKFAWMQVASFLVPTWLLVRAIKAFAFENQVIETYVISPLTAKAAT
eukprot:gnl/TRDRNA2_/TRDRNA2_85650_c0_seq3.p1 gnl/TRDRNA2_/TRDRNA2_85650_c0~~gnl/TRDRNA2_/TRDRNA2_85650_c0_seq3.p1  ORF type:complete len:202 (+),score=26.03 gnl/TRDRNA2_/TRDRNA2_85650_c0_seq3:125-730(+)